LAARNPWTCPRFGKAFRSVVGTSWIRPPAPADKALAAFDREDEDEDEPE